MTSQDASTIRTDLHRDAAERLESWVEDTFMRLGLIELSPAEQIADITFTLLAMFSYLISAIDRTPEDIGDKAREIIIELVKRKRAEEDDDKTVN